MKLRNKKTGEVIDLDIANIKAQHGGISVIPEPVKLGGYEYVYYSLDELVHEWEDYCPKEPLIKDEKIRKAVRAWADATGTTSVNYWWRLESCQNDAKIEFDQPLGFESGDCYIIYELCGEEEE